MTDEQQTHKALTELRVVNRCPANWKAMRGDDRARYCGQCSKNVYNLSAMSREEAAELILKTEGKVCVRYYLRPDGMVMTSDCPKSIKRKVAFRNALRTVASLLGIAVFFPVMGQTKTSARKTVVLSDFKQVERIGKDLKETRDPRKKVADLEKLHEVQENLKGLAKNL